MTGIYLCHAAVTNFPACPAQDSRAAVRVPFTQIVPTVAKVVDTSNEGSSGAGWTIGEGGLVRTPSLGLILGK